MIVRPGKGKDDRESNHAVAFERDHMRLSQAEGHGLIFNP